MLKDALRDEFEHWLSNVEWTYTQLELLDELDRKEKCEIIEKVLKDEQFTEEMFRCFEWYLNKYMTNKDDKWNSGR